MVYYGFLWFLVVAKSFLFVPRAELAVGWALRVPSAASCHSLKAFGSLLSLALLGCRSGAKTAQHAAVLRQRLEHIGLREEVMLKP